MPYREPERFRIVLGHPDQGIVWEVVTRFSFPRYDDPSPPVPEETYVSLVSVRFDRGVHHNTLFGYLHLLDEPQRPPFEPERQWVAKMWLPPYTGDDVKWKYLGAHRHEDAWLRRLLQRPPGIGASVIKWGLQGMKPQEVSAKYGDGSQIYLTAPVVEDGVTILPTHRS
jgi:hypothetical protein